MSSHPFDPDWVISPGETLRDWMDENFVSARVTARLCSMEPGELQRILDAKRRITPVVAAKLAAGTQIPARLWLNLERAYRDGLAAGKVDVSEPAEDAARRSTGLGGLRLPG